MKEVFEVQWLHIIKVLAEDIYGESKKGQFYLLLLREVLSEFWLGGDTKDLEKISFRTICFQAQS